MMFKVKKILDIFNKKYDCIFSLGAECYCAEVLTKCKLRLFSSPFDWLGGCSFEHRGDLICDDFKNFLNIEDLEKIGEREYPETCDIYKNNRTGIAFNHEFPKGEDFFKNYQKVKDKYDKRINRLIKFLNTSKNSLIIYMERFEEDMNNNEEIISLIKKINNKFNTENIDILYIKHNESMNDNEYNISQISKNAYVAELYNAYRDDKVPGNYKNCKRILSKIKLRKSFDKMLLKISKGRQRARVYLFGIKIMSFKFSN